MASGVVDAGALAIIAEQDIELVTNSERIFTPHPGEAAKLLACSARDIQNDRYHAAESLQARLGGVVVLKGAGTLIANGERIYVCEAGNAALAVGGTGDVLAGLLGALIAQGLNANEAAQLGVWVHGLAGDHFAQQHGQLGLKASELSLLIRRILNGHTLQVS